MLGRFLKPRWQHRDPEVRIRALESLPVDKADNRDALAQCARDDDDARVRAAAAGRLGDLQALNTLIEQDPAEEVRYHAARQIERLLAGVDDQAPDADYRRRLIEQTDNQDVLYFVACRSPDGASREAAVARLSEPDHLLEIALHGTDEPLRVAAARRLREPEALKTLTRKGRDKRVLQAAREALKAERGEQQRREELMRELERVESEAHHLAGQTPDRLYHGRLRQLEQQWERLRTDADAAVAERIEAELARCREKDEAREAERRQQERSAQAGEEQRAAVETLEQLLAEITPETWSDGTGSLASLLATQERRWSTACENADPPEALAQRFTHARDRLRSLLEQARAVIERESELQGLLTEARAAESLDEALRERIRTALPDWPGDIPPPEILRELGEALGLNLAEEASTGPDSASDATRNEDAHRVLGALRRELDKKNLRHANRLWHKARGLLDEHPDPSAEARMEKLRPGLEELRDWHAFAAEPKKRELCERMEALAEQDLEPEEKASAIQALHTEWQDLMSSDQEQDQALWDRFREASDRAYEPCRAYFRELDREKAANLERKQALCDQLEDYIQRLDPDHADWAAVWQVRQTAPREWKQYEPVRFTDARETRRRFSALLEQLDGKLHTTSEAHRPERERILNELESLADSDDPEEAARRARELQEQWKQCGWVHPNVYRGMNRRFRRLGDRIFQTRNEQRDARRADARARRQAVDTVLDRVEAKFEASPDELDLAALQADMDELDGLDCPPSAEKTRERRDAAHARFHRLRERLPLWRRWREARQRLEAAAEAEADDEQQRQLAVALEVLAEVESPESAREERTAWQLEQLPKAMTTGGNGDALDEILTRLEEADLDPLEPHIRDRLKIALDAVEPSL